jgi:hypothetical protein
VFHPRIVNNTNVKLTNNIGGILYHIQHTLHQYTAMPPRVFDSPRRPSFRHQGIQRRTFLGPQQTPPPNPRMMGYLVMQGLAVVLLADFGFAKLLNHPPVMLKIAQSAGIWKGECSFKHQHKHGDAD